VANGERSPFKPHSLFAIRYSPMHSLYVSRLTLTDFRNHAALDLQLDARSVCLFGPNGAGKTNILEALTMLAPGRGLRSASLIDVARTGGEDITPRGGRPPPPRSKAASSASRAATVSPRQRPISPKPRA
jgi:hypothetical protein